LFFSGGKADAAQTTALNNVWTLNNLNGRMARVASDWAQGMVT